MCPFAVLTQPRRCNALIEVCMKPSMTVNEVIRNWIRSKFWWYENDFDFSCVEIQSEVVEFMVRMELIETCIILLICIQEGGEE
jgi:hypothetical protein